MTAQRLFLAALLVLVVGLVIYFEPGNYLSLEQFQQRREGLQAWRDEHWQLAVAVYFALYVAVTALSIPGAAVMTLAGGALFGVLWGTLLVSFASSLGALFAFLIARTLLRDWVQARFAAYLKAVNSGVERDGSYFLFSLRLVPAVPFFALNLAMALTPMRAWPFYWVSQLGMLPGTVIYVNAGTQLGQLGSTDSIFSPLLVGSLVLLAVFPWLARALLGALQRRKMLRGFRRPKKFDYNLAVLGAGSGGLVSAYIAATVKARVVLIERERMGGDCLNTGCVPSKALIRSSRIARYIQRADEFGLRVGDSVVDFAAVMQRVQSVIERIEPHDSVSRYTGLGVECLAGEARVVSPWEVEVDGQRYSARNIIIATGGRPRVPDIPGIENTGYLTSETLWQLREQPNKLLVIGAGPIGCELAQAFSRLGCQVAVVEMFNLLPREDGEVAQLLREYFQEEGISLYERAKPLHFESTDDGQRLVLEHEFQRVELDFDCLLVAAGRAPNSEGLGLERVGVQLRDNATIEVDRHLRTACPTIYAVGDVTGPYQFTHAAAHQAWYAAVNSLFGSVKKFTVDYSVLPWVTFTDPEIARVGLNESDAQRLGVDYDVTRYDLDDLDRAIAEGEARGFIKVLTAPGKDRILGVTIVGYHASDMLGEFVFAVKHGLGLNKILATVHPYPTLGEANKYVAGEWRKGRKPEKLLQWVERFHRWRR